MAEVQVFLIDECDICKHPLENHVQNWLDKPICNYYNYYPHNCKCPGFKGAPKFRLIREIFSHGSLYRNRHFTELEEHG